MSWHLSRSLLLAVIMVMAIVERGVAQSYSMEWVEAEDEEVQVKETIERVNKDVRSRIHLDIDDLDPIRLPFIPMLSAGTVSLSLADLTFGGFSNRNFKLDVSVRPKITTGAAVRFNSISFTAGNYVAGGHVYSLPFVGESTLNVTLDGLNNHVQITKTAPDVRCAVPGSSKFNVTLDRLIVQFDNINPGQDTGDLINSMFSSIGDDICYFITDRLNNGQIYEKLDKLIVGAYNHYLCSNEEQEIPDTVSLVKEFLEIVKEIDVPEDTKLPVKLIMDIAKGVIEGSKMFP